MTAAEFRAARRRLGLSVNDLADILDTSERTIRKWEDAREARGPNPVAARVMEWLLDGYRPPQWPTELEVQRYG